MNTELVESDVNHHTIWPEKYRPTTLDGYIGSPEIKEAIQKSITSNDPPHYLFSGSPGIGKTTLAKLIANTLKCDSIYINASSENNVENIRTTVNDFASNIGFSELKIIILDEADYLTHNSQAALRAIMETHALSTRFILTCNYVEKISEAIISRCQQFNVAPLNKVDVAIHLKSILKKENITHTMEDIGYIVNTYYPDIRKILNFAQQSSKTGEMKITELTSSANAAKTQLVDILKKEKNKTVAFTKIRQVVADSDIRHFEELYELLFTKVSEYAPKQESVAILVIAEYLYQSAMVVNKEITFMACIAKLLDAIL